MLFESLRFKRIALFVLALGACSSAPGGEGMNGSGGSGPEVMGGGSGEVAAGGAGDPVGGQGGETATGGTGGNVATGGTTPNTGGSIAGGTGGSVAGGTGGSVTGGTGGTASATGGSGGTPAIANLKPAIMAAGYGALRLVSFDDGKTWRNRKVLNPNGGDDNNLIRAVNYVNGVWLAVGWKIFRSEDGLNWTEIDDKTVPGGWYDCVTYDPAKQIWIVKTVRADRGGQNGGAIISKDAGKTWTNSPAPTRCDRQPMPFNTGTAQLRSAWRGKIERASGGGFTQVLVDCCGVEMFARGMAVDEKAP